MNAENKNSSLWSRIFTKDLEHILSELPTDVLIVQNKPNALVDYKNESNALSTHDTNLSEKEVTTKDIQDYLKSRLANYKVPKFINFHVSMPREDSGKIFKRRLREPFWQAVGRKI